MTARDDTWARFRELGKRRAVDELDRLFAEGDAPQGLDRLAFDFEIRDELVEIVPGANLGKVLHRNADGGYRNWGFFALKPASETAE